MRMGVLHAVALHFAADVGCFVDAQFVWAIAPMTQCQDDTLREFVSVFALLYDLHQLLWRRQDVDTIEQFFGEVPDVLFSRVMDRENHWSQAETFELEDFPGTERLGERGETLEHIGKMEGLKRGGHLRFQGIAQGEVGA